MIGQDRKGRVFFTFRDALKLGYWYITRQMARTRINIASIALGIAFLTTLLMTDAFYRAYTLAGGDQLSVETYQYWLMFVALVVSVVGITNAMLIAVYERFREIGTMKCIGALDRHILLLFLVEALIQGVVGGAVGFVIGTVGALISTGFTMGFDILFRVPTTEFILFIGGSVLLSVILSIIATLYPAYRAAKLNPVEALSYEL